MTMDIYHVLREQLDQYSIGFPATESGVEIALLKKLFSESHAAMYLQMTLLLETPEVIAARAGMDKSDAAERCEQMARNGLVFRHRKGETVRYAAVPFVVGSYEFQLKKMDAELAVLCEQYMTEALFDLNRSGNVPIRTIPVNKSIDGSFPVASHDDARMILKSKNKIAVADCICRVQQHKIGNMCKKPMEVCFVFGSHAEYYVENGMARFITREEALSIQDKCEEYGLVNQPFNVINPGGMCNCCGCCCGVLRALNRHPRPVEVFLTSHQAAMDAGACSACGVCAARCQVNAISYGADAIARIDPDRCIGCGLCVTTCPTEAIRLRPLAENLRHMPPANEQELLMAIAKKRGTSLVPLKKEYEP
jgi:ferredoxin